MGGEELGPLLHLLLHIETEHHPTPFIAFEPIRRRSGRIREGRWPLGFDHLTICDR